MRTKGRSGATTVLQLKTASKMGNGKELENCAFVEDDDGCNDSVNCAKGDQVTCEPGSQTTDSLKKYSLGVLFLRRFFSCNAIIFPRLFCKSTILFALLLVASLCQQFIIYNVGLIPSRFFKVLGSKDSKSFKPLIFTALYFIVAIALANSAVKFISGILYVQWRDALTSSLHTKYFLQETFFHVNTSGGKIDNADQRITQDVDKFSQQLSEISPKLLISPLTIAYYSYKCFANTGWFGPVTIYGYFVVGSIINRIIMSPIVDLVVKQERNEGDFRYKHVNIRTNSESVVFLQGSQTEQRKADAKLQQLLGVQQTIVNYEFWLNLSVNLFDYLGSVLSYFVIAVPIFAGSYNDLSSVQLSSLISQNAFVSMYLINCFSTLMDLASKITDIAGYTHRIVELHEALIMYNNECKNNNKEYMKGIGNDVMPHFNKVFFDIKYLTYAPYGSKSNLVKDLCLTVMAGKSTLIMGATGTGKSSLLRLLRNIWQPISGEIESFLEIDPKSIYFLPQKGFLTSGSLFDQVMYPFEINQNDDEIGVEKKKARALQCIKDVGLFTLLERISGLETQFGKEWHNVLSPGEIQRLSFARIFYHKPRLAILDEPTSALGEEEEECFYTFCKTIGITLISVGHRESLVKYHENVLTLKGNGVWEFKDLQNQ